MSAAVQKGWSSPFALVCLAASTGGLAAYRTLLSRLPASFPAAVLLVQHRTAAAPDMLPELLAAHSSLPVTVPVGGERLTPGAVHVVAPATGIRLDATGLVTLIPAPVPLRAARPADDLFTMAAAAYGPRLIAAVLTGRLDDGALGVRHVKGAGGRVLAQDPDDSAAPGMPRAALATGCVDHVFPLPALADAVTALVMAPGAAEMMRVPLPSWARPIRPPRTDLSHPLPGRPPHGAPAVES